MATAEVILKSVLWLLLLLAKDSIQQCSVEVFENRIALDTVRATQATEANQNFMINRTIYNCLSTSQTIGMFSSMSVSILYTRSDTPERIREIRYDMMCVGSIWMRAGQKSTAFDSNDTRIDCFSCVNRVGNPLNDYHCKPCNESCTGLNQCYGPKASECCSFNDNGNCTAECGMNKEVNSTFHCVCSNFWTGDFCDNCSLVCMNGGTQGSDCSACDCMAGFEGTVCDVNIDECSPNPCQNGGNCTDLINDYNCTCVAGYAGKNCSIDINECESNPCLNGGSCTDLINSYNCSCAVGFNGTDCEFNIDDCLENPCENGGSCIDGIDDYNCTCVAGYTDKNCSVDVDDCFLNPCENDGTCIDLVDNYTCICMAGYTGYNCSVDINDCNPNPCSNGGNCLDELNGYTCACMAGFTGTDCEFDIDECSNSPCKNGGKCIDIIDGYTCDCRSAFSGPDCSDCTLPNCAECEVSDQNDKGKCTKCAGIFILDHDRGTCNENCGIPNCIICDKVDNKCLQCKAGYRITSDGGCDEERAVEEGHNSNKPSKDYTVVIIALSAAGLIVIFTIVTAFIALRYECKKSKLRRPNTSSRYRNL